MTILDTNVLSEVMAPSPADAPLVWIERRRAVDPVFITSITVAEILYGVEILPAGKRRERLNAETQAMFAQDFGGQILFFDEQAARDFAKIASSRGKFGRPIADFACQNAAISAVQWAALATRY